MIERMTQIVSEELSPEIVIVNILEIISGIQNKTTDYAEIGMQLHLAAQAEADPLTQEVLMYMGGIFKTMSDSKHLGPIAGFDENTAFIFASPQVSDNIKTVFKGLVRQQIGK